MLLAHIRRATALFVFPAFALPGWPLTRGYPSMTPSEAFAVLEGVAYFAAADGPEQANLWRTDGTAEGTRRVSQLPRGVTVHHPFVAGERIVFFVQDGSDLAVWEANGNTYETRLVTELANVRPELIRSAEGVAYFTSPDRDRGPHSTFLWRSDGTAAGTDLVMSLPFALDYLGVHHGLLYFLKQDDRSLWRSDGTSSGTFSLELRGTPARTVEGVWEAIAGAAENRVFFNSDGNVWQSDGTKAGTTQLLAGAVVTSAATLHGATYLTIGSSLYRLDGDVLTLLAAPPRPFAPLMRGLVSTGERLYFFYDGLWTRDSSGARPIRKLTPDPLRRVRMAGDLLYFTQDENLWRSDGTFEGTFGLTNLPRYSGRYDTPGALTALNGKLLFASSDEIHGREPWTSDGTLEGTRMLANVRPETVLRGRVYDRETGAPVTVRLYLDDDSGSGQPVSILTDTDGRFSIEGLGAGTYSLHTEAAYPYLPQYWRENDCGYCGGETDRIVVTAEGGVIEGVDFPLSRSGSISGRIVDKDGVPLQGVWVSVSEDMAGSRVVAYGSTDENGEYQTYGLLPPGPAWFVLATSPMHSGMIYDGGSCAFGCEPATGVKPVAVGNGQSVTGIDFVMTPHGSIRGRILDGLTGRPIAASAIITGRGLRDTRTTHSSTGEYELRLRDGYYHLLVQVPGGAYSPAYYPNVPCSDPACMELRGVPVAAVPGKTILGYDIVVMPRGARVRGRVVDGATGVSLADIRITVLDANGAPVARTRTTTNGLYETPPSLGPGTYRVRAERSDGHEPLTHPAEVTVSGTDIARVDLLLDRLSAIVVSVIDAKTRQPLVGARVVITDPADTVIESMRTGVDGRYTATTLSGRFAVHAEKIGWVAKDAEVSVINGETGNVELRLEPACEVAVAPVSRVARAGGETTLAVSAPCAACAFETAPFFAIVSGSCNSPVLTLRFDENPGPARRGTIVFPGKIVEVVQEGF